MYVAAGCEYSSWTYPSVARTNTRTANPQGFHDIDTSRALIGGARAGRLWRLKTPRYGLSAPVIGERVITLGGTTYTPYSPNNRFPFKPVNIVEILDTEQL
jgi:hypothetical protein